MPKYLLPVWAATSTGVTIRMLSPAFHLIVESYLFLLQISSKLVDPTNRLSRIASPSATLLNDVSKRGHGFVEVVVPKQTVIGIRLPKLLLSSLESRVQLVERFAPSSSQALNQHLGRRR